MDKKIKRKEVDIFIGDKTSNGGSSKLAAGGMSILQSNNVNTINSSPYQLPDPESLSNAYGVPRDEDIDALTSTIENMKIAHNSKVSELEGAILSLKSKVEEKNKKIENLCVLLESLEPVPGVNANRLKAIADERVDESNADLRDVKIVSLAKKSHNLTMLLNKERANNDKLEQELQEWRKRCDILGQELESAKTAAQVKADTKVYNRNTLAAAAKKEEEEQNTQMMQKTLKDSQKSIDDLKKKIKELTDENKNLSKALARELGEGVSIEQAVDGGWRGRAQQIVMLKAKIKQLENSSNNTNRSSNRGLDVDSKAEEELVEMSKERRQIVEALTEERVQLIENNQALEKKNSALRARIQILENETRRMKENLQVAIDKSISDDQLLDALRNEISKLQSKLKATDDSRGMTSTSNKIKSGTRGGPTASSPDDLSSKEQQYQSEIQRLKRLCNNQAEQLDSQDKTIRELRQQLNPY